jgi:peptidyl-prolyl cis-trans isomerase B (cyclophilin B)
VASTKDRQRKLARARAERRLKVLAARQRRKRQTYAIVALSVTLVAALGLTWALGGFGSSDEDSGPRVISGSCSWVLKDPAQDPNMVEVGYPNPEGAPRVGTQTMTLKTNLGDIEATIDLSKAPCTASSFSYLAGEDFFNDSKCHRLSNPAVLQCGDPKATARIAGYQFADGQAHRAGLPAPTTSPTTGLAPRPRRVGTGLPAWGQIVM